MGRRPAFTSLSAPEGACKVPAPAGVRTGEPANAAEHSTNEQSTMNSMDSATLATATLHLVDAEAAYAEARQRLHAAQRAAVLGVGDSLALDEAVLAYRSARAELAAARAAWRREYGAIGGTAAGRASEDGALTPAEAPEVRFARWLLEATERGAPALAA